MSVLRTSIKAYTLHPIFIVIESWRCDAYDIYEISFQISYSCEIYLAELKAAYDI